MLLQAIMESGPKFFDPTQWLQPSRSNNTGLEALTSDSWLSDAPGTPNSCDIDGRSDDGGMILHSSRITACMHACVFQD